ncbi:MAG TPA: sensor histidine kinase [Rhodanobacteraceae bacterium]|nr:sensor histidine kinase [Rhodanobacteraceae bacterium]
MSQSATASRIPAYLLPAPDSLWAQMQRSSGNPKLHLFNFLWSLWIFATLFFTEVESSFWWTVGLGYPLFVALFWLVHVRPFAEMRLWAGLMASLALLTMLWNPAGWTYAVFGCVYSGMASCKNPRLGILRIGMIVSMMASLAWWLDWPWFVILMSICVCLSSGLGAMFGYMSQLRNLELRHSHEEVRRLAAATERERIGRDLHDLLGHTLSLITLKLELSRRLFDRDPEASRRELIEAEHEARKALAEVRAAVTGIRATDLAAELASARLMLQSSGVVLECSGAAPDLPPEIERDLSLLLREACTNVVRHARATRVQLTIRVEAGNVHLRISDNGRGGVVAGGNGLTGMRERVRALGGVLRIDSPRGSGTTLEVLAPLKPPREIYRDETAAGPAVDGTARAFDASRLTERPA